MHKDKVLKAREIILDTTVQPKNITYPTDEKLYKKVIDRCNHMAGVLGVKLRQSYRFTVKKLLYAKRYASLKSRWQEGQRVIRKLRTLAGRQVRDLGRHIASKGGKVLEQFSDQLTLMARAVSQNQGDKNKVYSLHAPEVSCIAKGKAYPKYEFGSKVSLAIVPGSNVIVGIKSYAGNPHDSKTLSESVGLSEGHSGREFGRVVVDKGYRGHGLKGKEVLVPGDRQSRSPSGQRRYKASCRRRCGIEAIISHLKGGHGLGVNYLQGRIGDSLNALLSAIGFNMKLLMRELTTGRGALTSSLAGR